MSFTPVAARAALCALRAEVAAAAAEVLARRLPGWTGQIAVVEATAEARPSPGMRAAVVYLGWEEAVLAAMVAGTPPRAALQAWLMQAEALLALHRANRRGVMLVPLDFLRVAEGPALLEALRAAGIEAAAAATPPAAPAAAGSGPLARALARLAFVEEPGATAAAAMLEASSLPLPGEAPAAAVVDAAFAELAALNERLGALEEQRALLVRQCQLQAATGDYPAPVP